MAFKTSDFRPAIIRMHENGKSMNQIAKDLGISRCAVQDAVKRFEETGSIRDSRLASRQLPRRHHGGSPLATPNRWMASKQPGSQPTGLLDLGDSWRKSMPETAPERRIFKACIEKGLERNQFGGPDQDCRQRSETLAGLHWCEWWPFWMNLIVLLLFVVFWINFVETFKWPGNLRPPRNSSSNSKFKIPRREVLYATSI